MNSSIFECSFINSLRFTSSLILVLYAYPFAFNVQSSSIIDVSGFPLLSLPSAIWLFLEESSS